MAKYVYDPTTGQLISDKFAAPRPKSEAVAEGVLSIRGDGRYTLTDGELYWDGWKRTAKAGKITIYGKNDDCNSNGLAVLMPTQCTVHEEAGGVYELELVHPMDADGRWEQIEVERIIKAPVPMRLTPEFAIYSPTERTVHKISADSTPMYNVVPYDETRTYYIWVKTPIPETTRYEWIKTPRNETVHHGTVLETLVKDVEVSFLRTDSNPAYTWIVAPSGQQGVVATSALSAVIEVIQGEPVDVVQAKQIRSQLFRIYRTTIDTNTMQITAYARHIFYDQLGEVITYLWLQTVSYQSALNSIKGTPPGTTDFRYYVQVEEDDDTIEEEYTQQNVVEAQLDPDTGVLKRSGKRLVRDNWDVYYLASGTTRSGTLEYAKNLLGVTLDVDLDGVVNRIVPYGKDADDNMLYLDGWFVDSDDNDENTIIRGKAIEYDVKTGENGIETDDDGRTKLVDLADADLAEMSQPKVEMTVDFLLLGDTVEYAQYHDLDRLYLYDTVPIRDVAHGINVDAEITEYDYDCLTERYTSIRIGTTSGRRAWNNIVY